MPKKDDGKPKRPASAYVLWCNANRDRVKKEMAEESDDVKAKEVQKELAKQWKEVDEDEKEKFKKIYQKNKAEYEKQMENAGSGSEDEDSGDKKKRKRNTKTKKSKKPKDKDAPKRPLSAYQIFQKEKRPEVKEQNKNMDAKEIMKELARLWKELDEDEKKPFQEKAELAKAQHKKDVEEYEKKKKNKDEDEEEEEEEEGSGEESDE
ncbi:hypothetical protein ABK040_001774 [Willaertia magna]